MHTMKLASHLPIQEAVEALSRRGWGVIDGLLPDALWQALAQQAEERFTAGHFHHAGIGGRAQVAHDIRGDHILWLTPERAQGPEVEFWTYIEALRLAINRTLWLGLFEYECHYARYPVGARYERHLDRPRGREARTVTLINYLNSHWREADGGQLRIYPDQGEPVEILPEGGRAVIFLTDGLPHEVLPARRPRLALTGWFRRRPTSATGV